MWIPDSGNLVEEDQASAGSNGGGGDPDDPTHPGFEPEDDDSNCFYTEREDYPWYGVALKGKPHVDRVEIRAGNVDSEY